MPAPSPLWILGAADAEMTAIETLLHECGQSVHYALAATGRRVAPGQPAATYDGVPEVPPHELIAIEVAGPWGAPQIDHHDGSERAGWGPDRFLAASSIGQVIERLAQMGALPDAWAADHVYQADGIHYHGEVGTWVVGPTDTGRIWVIPQALVMEAATDHCPAAAVAGRCPGIDRATFIPFLAESKRRMYFPTMSAEDFMRELEVSRATLRMAPPCAALDMLVPTEIMGPNNEWYNAGMQPAGYIRDLRDLEPGDVPAQGSGECYPSTFLVGIVAALFEGVGFVCRIRRKDGKLALRSNGHGQGTLAGTRPAEVFLADPAAFGCGPTHPPGQDASYGNPVRGFFGGTLINQEL